MVLGLDSQMAARLEAFLGRYRARCAGGGRDIRSVADHTFVGVSVTANTRDPGADFTKGFFGQDIFIFDGDNIVVWLQK